MIAISFMHRSILCVNYQFLEKKVFKSLTFVKVYLYSHDADGEQAASLLLPTVQSYTVSIDLLDLGRQIRVRPIFPGEF